jgi:hypothetical protein
VKHPEGRFFFSGLPQPGENIMPQITQVPVPAVRYLSERKVAEITGLSVQKLQQDRHYRRGIPYCKIGRTIRYPERDVLTFMEEHRIVPAEVQ